MFEKFLKYVGLESDERISDEKTFCEVLNGRSFLNGMYRLFARDEIQKWNQIVGEAFPTHKNQFECFGYDWLGRIFAIDKNDNTVVMLEPGTGKVLRAPVDFVAFHDVEIVEYSNDSLASNGFEEWFEKNGHYHLKNNECAGYKIPLFLNGDDTIDNMEVSDMEVYWEIMMPLMNL